MKVFYFTEDVDSPKINEKIIELSLNFLGLSDTINFQQEGIEILGADINNLKKFQTLISNVLAKAILEQETVIFCFHIDTEVDFDIFQSAYSGKTNLLEDGTNLKKYLKDYQIIVKMLFNKAIRISENLKSGSFVEMIPCNAMENWCAANRAELLKKKQVKDVLEQIFHLPFKEYLEELDEIGNFKFGRKGKGVKTMSNLVNNNFPTQDFYNVEKSFHRFVENLRLAIN